MAVRLVHEYLGGLPAGARCLHRASARSRSASLDDAELDRLAGLGAERRLAAGEFLFREGERATHFQVLLDGRLENDAQVAGEPVLMLEPLPRRLPRRDGPAHRHPLPREHPGPQRRGRIRARGRRVPRARAAPPHAGARLPPGDRERERHGQDHRARPREAPGARSARRRARAPAPTTPPRPPCARRRPCATTSASARRRSPSSPRTARPPRGSRRSAPSAPRRPRRSPTRRPSTRSPAATASRSWPTRSSGAAWPTPSTSPPR